MNILLTILLKALGVVGVYLITFLTKVAINEINSVLPLALKAVTDVAKDPEVVDSEARFRVAKDKLLREMTNQSVVAGASTINWAIETAYQKFKVGE